MGEIATILQNAILYVAGSEGLAKFNKAGYDVGMSKVVHPDGSIDLPRLMNTLLDVFPEKQASAITDNVLAKYVELSEIERKGAAAEAAVVPAAPEPAESSEENLAKYLATESSDVRDLINEARRIRLAMGRSALPAESEGQHVLREAPPATPEPPRVSIVNPGAYEPSRVPLVSPAAEVPDIAALVNSRPYGEDLSPESLDAEIRRFADSGKSYTSVDIMDFIRYLKDKGYHFQETSVLERVYTRLEERKSRERTVLMSDIQGFLGRVPWPSESEVSAYIEQKKNDGIMCEGSEIKRMILVEMIRKH